jgi:hypothetical protein
LVPDGRRAIVPVVKLDLGWITSPMSEKATKHIRRKRPCLMSIPWELCSKAAIRPRDPTYLYMSKGWSFIGKVEKGRLETICSNIVLVEYLSSHERVLETDNPVHIHILRVQKNIRQLGKAIQIIRQVWRRMVGWE